MGRLLRKQAFGLRIPTIADLPMNPSVAFRFGSYNDKFTFETKCAATPALHRKYVDTTQSSRRLDLDEIFHALILSSDQ